MGYHSTLDTESACCITSRRCFFEDEFYDLFRMWIINEVFGPFTYVDYTLATHSSGYILGIIIVKLSVKNDDPHQREH